jgi:hypothetical protein
MNTVFLAPAFEGVTEKATLQSENRTGVEEGSLDKWVLSTRIAVHVGVFLIRTQ